MGSNRTIRVPLATPSSGAVRVATLEDGATRGATVGVDLVLEDGTVVKARDILNRYAGEGSDNSDNPTLWRLIGEIPANIVAIAALTGGGFAFMDSVGVWRLRRVGRQVIGFAFGDGSPATIWTTPHALMVTKVRVKVEAAFNGTGASVQVGTTGSPGLLLPVGASLLSALASHEYTADEALAAGVAVRITITPGSGASAGAGKIIIDSIPLEGI